MKIRSNLALGSIAFRAVGSPTQRVQLESPAPPSLEAAPVQLPSFQNKVDVKGSPREFRQTALFEASDAWVDANVKLSRSDEAPAFKGLGRWVASQDMLKVRPDWLSYRAAEQTSDLWDDEYPGATSTLAKAGADADMAARKSLMVLRMLDSYVGDGVVDGAVRRTLQQATGSPRSLEDLYSAIVERSGTPLPPWSQAKAWFQEVGHPMVASRLVQADGKTSLRLDQSGFSVYPDLPIGNEQASWAVPLRIKFKDEEGIKEIKTVLADRSALVELPAKGKVSWAFPNGGGEGVYRTRMSRQEMRTLGRDFHSLSPAEQGALACNQWRLVRNGVADVGEFYDLCQAMGPCLDPGLVGLLDTELMTHANYARPEDRQAFARFAADLVRPMAYKRGLSPAPESDQETQTAAQNAARLLAPAGDPGVLRAARRWAEEYKHTGAIPLGAYTHTLSGDPEVLAILGARANDRALPVKERFSAFTDLCFWPNKDGAVVALQVLDDPNSGFSEKERDILRATMTYGPHGTDLLLSAFQADPGLVEKHKDLLKQTYTFPAYRDQVMQLLQSPNVSAATRAELTEHFSHGDRKTLAHFGDAIHTWLVKAGYQTEVGPEQGWILL
jgi:hypothetical protein